MGYSKVELANQALDHLGKDNIASLTEVSTAARKANAMLSRVIETALARSHWSFARKIASLPGLTADWTERWAYKYDLPNDMVTLVRMIPLVDVQNTEPQAMYELKGGALYTNENTCKVEYVYVNEETLTWPQPFLDAVAYLLARDLAMPLTRKPGLRTEMHQYYEMQISRAVEHDSGQEPTSYVQKANSYLGARGASDDELGGAAPDGSIYWR